MRKSIGLFTAAALTLSGSVTFAHVIDPATDKAAAKLRADVAKQVAKYTFCLVKAAAGCEKGGATSAVECNLGTGAVAYEMPAGAATAKFNAAIGKCDDKMVLSKKGNDYIGIGCPGDCDAGTPGVQQCAGMSAFEASVESAAASSAKGQLGLLATLIDLACGTDLGVPNTDPARIKCATDQAKLMSKYAQGVFKCQAKCENDFKNSKGNGGPSNGAECKAGDVGAAPAFATCVSAGLGKVSPKFSPSVAALVPAINAVVNDATGGLYNRFDPTTADPSASPCGTCGNATREGAEQCDGADDAFCGGPACKPDCTCP
ncbi:hypothetical protein KF840_02300 [bacterium]|nr:hypothetical protein [bacterium]